MLAAPTKSSLVGMIGSPADGNVEDRGTNGVDFDCWETVGMHGIEHSPVWGGDEDRMPPAAEDILKTERDQDLGLIIEDYPITNYGRLFRRPVEAVVALPDDCENTPAAVSQSWLYGHTTLQQTGQSIGAELEVAMLCMQKRLAKVKTICWINVLTPPGSQGQICICCTSTVWRLFAHAPPPHTPRPEKDGTLPRSLTH